MLANMYLSRKQAWKLEGSLHPTGGGKKDYTRLNCSLRGLRGMNRSVGISDNFLTQKNCQH